MASMSDSNEQPAEIPNHESPVRRMISDAHGLVYHPLRLLDEAKASADGVVILEGDWGGQIYVVCPAGMVACDAATLRHLLQDLDAIAWDCNEGEGARVYFERTSPGRGVAGGMGGGEVTGDIWVHAEFREKPLADNIRQVILGERSRIVER